jgi:hypothetical protein
MDEKWQQFLRLTDYDGGGVAVVASLYVIVITLCICFIRYTVATRKKIQFQKDDAAFFLASVSCICYLIFRSTKCRQLLAVASSVCVYRAVLTGLGRHVEGLNLSTLQTYFKVRTIIRSQ